MCSLVCLPACLSNIQRRSESKKCDGNLKRLTLWGGFNRLVHQSSQPGMLTGFINHSDRSEDPDNNETLQADGEYQVFISLNTSNSFCSGTVDGATTRGRSSIQHKAWWIVTTWPPPPLSLVMEDPQVKVQGDASPSLPLRPFGCEGSSADDGGGGGWTKTCQVVLTNTFTRGNLPWCKVWCHFLDEMKRKWNENHQWQQVQNVWTEKVPAEKLSAFSISNHELI